MTPKSETMWMAWHKSGNHYSTIYAPQFVKKELVSMLELRVGQDWKNEYKIESVTIQPKKRGKG